MIIQRRSGQGVVGPGFGVRLAGRPEVRFLAHGRLLKMRALFFRRSFGLVQAGGPSRLDPRCVTDQVFGRAAALAVWAV